ncbi:MAG: hypothetical protein ABSE08_02675 [Syntrophobacteraceae bacterium]|jgi:hypothetical protein
MTLFQIKRLIRLHERAERHSSEYKRLSADLGTQSKALCHLRKAERLYSQIAALIKDSTLVQVCTGEKASGTWLCGKP